MIQIGSSSGDKKDNFFTENGWISLIQHHPEGVHLGSSKYDIYIYIYTPVEQHGWDLGTICLWLYKLTLLSEDTI